MDWSSSAASPLEELAYAEARRYVLEVSSAARNIAAQLARERDAYRESVIASEACALGVSVADVWDTYNRLLHEQINALLQWGPG